MNFFNMFLLDAPVAGAAGQAPQGGLLGGWSTLLMMVVLILIFWLFFIRPQSKKQKEIQKKREALGNGDKVITAGGIHGTIKQVGDSYFLIEVDKDIRIRVEKTSVYPSVEDKVADNK